MFIDLAICHTSWVLGELGDGWVNRGQCWSTLELRLGCPQASRTILLLLNTNWLLVPVPLQVIKPNQVSW